jgi:RNA polymerase sigma-70 factor (ECF subfamily)
MSGADMERTFRLGLKPHAAEIPDERGWIERARLGDRAAYDALVRLHYPRVHGLAWRLVGSPEDAEDLAQDTFVKAHASLAWYRADGSFGGWLRCILVHLARDRFRAQSRRPADTSLELADEPALRREPTLEAGGRELVRLVDAALRRLPGRLRVALVLRSLEGLEYEEVAKSTGVTPATARTHVMQARKLLVRWLAPHLERREP